MKRYYRIIKFLGKTTSDTVWHCSHDTAFKMKCDLIIPLERKPRNVEILEA